MTEFEKQIARSFCEGCNLYVEKFQSCRYVDDSGRDKFCQLPLSKLKELFALRSPEGYRLAIINEKDYTIICKRKDSPCPNPESQHCNKCQYACRHYAEVKEGVNDVQS